MSVTIRKRSEIEEKYTWNLGDIYESDEAWQADYQRVSGKIQEIEAFNGKVAENPEAAIRTYFTLQKEFLPVFMYAMLRKEADNTDPKAQALKDQAIRLHVQVMTAGAFLKPELLDKIGRAHV